MGDPYAVGGSQTTSLAGGRAAARPGERQLTIATLNVTGGLSGKLASVIKLLGSRVDVLAITETHLQNHNFVTALRLHRVYIITVNRPPSKAAVTTANVPQRGSGGVAFISLNSNVRIRTLASDASGVLTVEAWTTDSPTEHVALTVVYAPPASSTVQPVSSVFATARAETLAALAAHVARFTKSHSGRYVVMGDLNARMSSKDGEYTTNDTGVTSHESSRTSALLNSMDLMSIHGRVTDGPAHTTSVGISMVKRVANGEALPQTSQAGTTHFTLVDYILVPAGSANTSPCATVPWTTAAGLPSTHRPVIGTITVKIKPVGDREPPRPPSCRVAPAPPYNSTLYNVMTPGRESEAARGARAPMTRGLLLDDPATHEPCRRGH